MTDNTQLYIQTSQKNMILENQFDTVYHEHQSFFNTHSMKILCEANQLVLNHVDEHPIHGTSYIFKISKTQTPDSNVTQILEEEKNKGLYLMQTYKTYTMNCLYYKNKFSNKVIHYKLNQQPIIAFGCTAKSMTVFNYCKLTHDTIDFMIDENPLKHNTFTPGSQIPIRGMEVLKDIRDNTVIIVTAWNFYDEIKQKIKDKKTEYAIPYGLCLLNINTLLEEFI